jgi:hypothetical protein
MMQWGEIKPNHYFNLAQTTLRNKGSHCFAIVVTKRLNNTDQLPCCSVDHLKKNTPLVGLQALGPYKLVLPDFWKMQLLERDKNP